MSSGCKRLDPPAHAAREAFDKGVGRAARRRSPRSRNGGTRNGKDIQPVKEVFAKFPFAHHAVKIAIGGGDDAHVHLARACAAERFEFAFLQHAQQFGLKVQRQFADFIEENASRRPRARTGLRAARSRR